MITPKQPSKHLSRKAQDKRTEKPNSRYACYRQFKMKYSTHNLNHQIYLHLTRYFTPSSVTVYDFRLFLLINPSKYPLSFKYPNAISVLRYAVIVDSLKPTASAYLSLKKQGASFVNKTNKSLLRCFLFGSFNLRFLYKQIEV